MKIPDTVLVAFIGLISGYISNVFMNKKSGNDTDSNERIAIMQGSGVFAKQLSEALKENERLIDKINDVSEELGLVKNERDELKTKLEEANRTIKDLLEKTNGENK